MLGKVIYIWIFAQSDFNCYWHQRSETIKPVRYYRGGPLERVICSTRITVTLSIFNFSTWFFAQIVENQENQLRKSVEKLLCSTRVQHVSQAPHGRAKFPADPHARRRPKREAEGREPAAAGHGDCEPILAGAAVSPPGPQRIIARMLCACGIKTDRSQHYRYCTSH